MTEESLAKETNPTNVGISSILALNEEIRIMFTPGVKELGKSQY